MKIEGTEKEMKHLFREKRKGSLFGFDKRKGKPLGRQFLIWMAITGLVVLMILVIIYLNQYNDNRITTSDCTLKIEQAQLQMTNQLDFMTIFVIYAPIIKVLIILIGLAWLFNGVGFRII